MNPYYKLTRDCADAEETSQQLLETLRQHRVRDGFSELGWEDLYWISRHLYRCDASGDSDEPVMRALEYAHAHGMNAGSNRELYLDGLLMLANKYLKYGQFYQTINCITELRDNGGELPDRVHVYYCIAMTYAYPRQTLTNPDGIIDSIRAVRVRDKETARMVQAAVKRYLDIASELLDQPGFQIGKEHLAALHDALREKELDGLPEWKFFVRRALKDEAGEIQLEGEEGDEPYPETPVGDAAPHEALMQENQALQVKVRHLEEQVLLLQDTLQEQTRQLSAREVAQPVPVPDTSCLVTGRRKRLLVFGDNRVPEDKLKRYANAIGFPSDNIDFYLDYEKNRRFDLNKIRFHSPYAGILVGPNAHKMVNLGDYPSMLSKLRNEGGFPHFIEMRTHSRELKITKKSFETAMMRMMDHIEATME